MDVEGEGEGEVAQSCPTLSDSVDCSLPGSSVHGIFQARMLECWNGLPFPSPGDSSRPRNQTRVSRIAGRRFTVWATGEAHGCGTHRQPTVHAFWSRSSRGSNWIIHLKLLCVFFNHVFNLADLTLFLNFSCSCRWQLNTQVARGALKVKCLLCAAYILHSAISFTFSKCSEITYVIWQKK